MRESNSICDLKSCFLCQRCLPDWLPAVKASKQNVEFKKGEQIFKEGEPVTGIYFVYKGAIKVHKKWDIEKELIIRFSQPGDVIGYLGLGNEPIYPVTATALEPSVLCFLDINFLESTLRVNNDLTYSLMRLLASDLQDSHKSMRDMVHMPVKARVAQSMIALKKQFGTDENGVLKIEITRQDLASYAGVSYETLFKTLTEFTSNGLVQANGKKIIILKDEGLQAVVER